MLGQYEGYYFVFRVPSSNFDRVCRYLVEPTTDKNIKYLLGNQREVKYLRSLGFTAEPVDYFKIVRED